MPWHTFGSAIFGQQWSYTAGADVTTRSAMQENSTIAHWNAVTEGNVAFVRVQRFTATTIENAHQQNLSVAQQFAADEGMEARAQALSIVTMAVPGSERLTSTMLTLDTRPSLQLWVSSIHGPLWEVQGGAESGLMGGGAPHSSTAPFLGFAHHGRYFLRGVSVLADRNTVDEISDCGRKLRLAAPSRAQRTAATQVLSNTEVRLVRALFHAVVESKRAIVLRVAREHLVAELANFWEQACAADVLTPLQVIVDDEVAIDGGVHRGVSTDILSSFVACVVEDWGRATRKYGPKVDRALGCVVAKILLLGKAVDLSLLQRERWRVIFGADRKSAVDRNRNELELLREYDPQAASHLESVLNNSRSWHSLEDENGSPLTARSAPLFVERTAQSLRKKIEEPLSFAAAGFATSVDHFPSVARDLLCPDGVLQLLEPDDQSATTLVGRFEFRGWLGSHSTPYLLCCWVHSADANDRGRFIQMITGAPVVSQQAAEKIIVIRSPDRFAVKTCFWQLLLPDFDVLA
eukprot:CAMPEP_0174867834 /NCGR_PEP_ID=MMETSP1114-20130205/64825_1 /TAXON_ID=312471 /ORGANISM="Neobodo designis, Strain CCAP 1951/1" /LENGTH=519 /DNA_ID=CAMNT_0016103039 /DNA_START=175 /DNA_END=1730 /DNA_ORIENTATION=+